MKCKLTNGIWIGILIVLGTSCDKVNIPANPTSGHQPSYTYWGEAHASLNGQAWMALPLNGAKSPAGDICLTFSLVRFDSVTYIAKETIGFVFYGCEPGETYELVKRSIDSNHSSPPEVTVTFGVVEGVDAVLDKYRILEGPGSTITIHSFDPATEEIKATFQGMFVIDSISPASAPPYVRWLPDTLVFENGYIHSKHVE